MQCVFEDGSVFTKIIEGIKELCPEGNLDFSKDGMHMQVMDAAHVSLCSMLMRTNLFKSYSCTEPVSLGINFKTLSMMLKNSSGELKLELSGDNLIVTVHKMSGTAQYTLKLMDIDAEHLGLPDVEYAANCVLPSVTFGKVMKDLSDFSDSCTIHIDDTLYVSSSGYNGKVEWKSDDCKCVGSTSPLEFSLRYMCLFSKCAVSPKVVLSMSDDIPISITFPIDQYGHMRFYLAPRTMD